MSSEPISFRGMQCLAVTGPFVFISLFVVSLRLYTKFSILKNPGLEDLFVTLAWICTATLWGLLFWLAQYHGMGVALANLPPLQMAALPGFLKIFFGCVFLYNFSLSAAKLSIVIQYLRIFPSGPTRYASWAGLALVCANIIWTFFINLFFCVPVQKFWDRTLPGTCLPEKAAYFSYAGANIGTSCIVILIPIPAILKLKMAWKTKTALILIFGLGMFDVILGCLRLSSLSSLVNSADLSYWTSEVAIWSSLESTVAIICASAPVLRPLFSKWMPGLFSTGPSESGQGTPGRYSGHGSRSQKRSWRRSVQQTRDSDYDFEMQPEVGAFDGDSKGGPDLTMDDKETRVQGLKRESSQTWLHEASGEEFESASPTHSYESRPATYHRPSI